jgi:hypothetical protein
VLAPLAPEHVEQVRHAAQDCLKAVSKGCYDTWTLAFFDIGLGEDKNTYMDDGSFVIEQSITDPRVYVDDTNSNRLGVEFHHSAKVRVVRNGTPIGLLMERSLVYGLVRAPTGGADQWVVDSASAEFEGSAEADPFTFAPIEQPAS